MEKIKCPKCGFDGEHKIAFNFNSPELDMIQKGTTPLNFRPQFRLKCMCGDCGKYIKFLSFRDNLIKLHNKIIEY